jgi:hypothetical protein
MQNMKKSKALSLLLPGIMYLSACEQHKCPEDVTVHVAVSQDKGRHIIYETTVKNSTDTLKDKFVVAHLPMPLPPAADDTGGGGSPRDTLLITVWSGKPTLKKDDDD